MDAIKLVMLRIIRITITAASITALYAKLVAIINCSRKGNSIADFAYCSKAT